MEAAGEEIQRLQGKNKKSMDKGEEMGKRGFIRAVILVSLLVLGFSIAIAAAGPNVAVVTNVNDRTISTIDLNTSPATVYGPFLAGQLGSGMLAPVKTTPDGHYALVGNFNAQTVYRVDISDPSAPVLAGSVNVSLYPEQMAIASDGAFAMVTDGSAFSSIAVIDMSTFTLKTAPVVPGATYITGIAIAPDNQTWVAADESSGQVFFGTYSLASGFTFMGSLPAGGSPNSVAISPDGQTVLVPNRGSSVGVYDITSPGSIVSTGTITGLQFAQSAAFAPDGLHAYVLDVYSGYVAALDITSPGHAALADATAAYVGGGDTYFGVDCLAVTPDGVSIIVGNNGTRNVAKVDTGTYLVTTIATDTDVPLGVAITASSFDTVFQDDGLASQLCVSSKTGAFQWTVMSGPYTGMTFTGTLRVYNGGTMFWSMPGSSQYVYLYYDPNNHRAWGYLYDYSTYVYSSLYDFNTLNDPATCGASLPPV